MSDKLSTADIERLLEDPSIDTRTETARKIAGGVTCVALTPCVDCTVSAVTAATP